MPTDTVPTNERDLVDQLVTSHFEAELAGDLEGVLETFTDDVVHDVVGFPAVSRGKAAVAAFYAELRSNLAIEAVTPRTGRRRTRPMAALTATVRA